MRFYISNHITYLQSVSTKKNQKGKNKKAPEFSEALVVAGTGLEPVTFGL